MDELWQSAPVPALRVWRAAPTPRWSPNAAAADWALLNGITDADWLPFAIAGLAQVERDGGGTDVPVSVGRVPLRCRAIALDDGALLWLCAAELLPAEAPAVALGTSALGRLPPSKGDSRSQQREASEFLGRALVLADVSVWRIDLSTRRVHYNLRGWRQMGIEPTPEGVDLDQVRDTVHPDDRAGIVKAAQEALASDRVVDVIARYRNPDGSWRTLLTRRVAYRDAAGAPIALAGVSLDLSALVSEREHVLQLQERMDLMAHAVGLGIWSRDVESGIAEWNEQMYRMHHRSPSEGPPTIAEWLRRHVHPLDRERMAREQADADEHWTPIYQTEFRIPGDGGEVRWIYSWSRREKRLGRQMAFGVHIDITDRRSAEQELQRERARAQFAINAAGMGAWERSLEGQPLYWSERMYALYGVDPGDTRSLERLAAEAMTSEDRQALQVKARRHVLYGEPYDHELTVRWPDGSTHCLVSRGQVVRDDEGRPQMLTGVSWDITERKQAEGMLREKQRAEQASRAKSEFMARMSHELRTPLNAVLGFTQLLFNDAQQQPTARQRERLGCIQSASEHLLSLIDDVLDLSRIEADPRPATREAVVLEPVCAEAVEWLADAAARHSVRIERDALYGAVLGERRQVGQILTNLLSNAIKYNRRGGWVRIAGDVEAVDGAACCRIEVSDSGRGIAPERLPQLFEPFERLGAERENIEGTGIGLTIVRQLVERLQGRIEVRSEAGVGSVFTVWLPAADEAAIAAASRPPSGHAPGAAAAMSRLKVLCIEDNPVNMMLVREMLAMRPGIEMQGAETGGDGIAAAKASRPDLVLLDLQLPDQHGSEVLRRLREEPSLEGVRVVALSANAMPEDVDAAIAQGFDDYWTKPIELNAFLQRIDAVIAAQARTRAA